MAEQDLNGYALRSRCDLVCEGKAPLEVVGADGSSESLTLEVGEALDLFRATFAAAKDAGFDLQETPLALTPQDKLVEIVRQSQKLALAGKGEDTEESQG
ncbi:MAG TPA: hypothetical protein VGD59_01125 [Acidisarcina sp.]